MPRGGRREPNGQANPNRTDLNGPKLPAQAASGQPYGQAGAQLASQAAVPMGPPPTGMSAPPATGSPGPQPGALDFARPTERPNEPITTAPPAPPDDTASLSALLNHLGQTSPAVAQLAAYVQGGRQ